MARISQQELVGRLEKGKPVPAILLLGEEPYLRDACRKLLIERFVPEASRTWAVSRYSADRGETQAALDQAQTMAMLSPQQVVFLEDVEAIEKLGERNRDEAVAQLGAYLEDPAPFTVLVMEATGLDQRMKLGKLLAEETLVVECGLGENAGERQAAAVALARAIGKEQGVEFEKGAADDLAEFVAADLMRLKTEIDKLATYVAEKRVIGRADVSALVISETVDKGPLATSFLAEVTHLRLVHRVPHRTSSVFRGLVNIRGQLQLCVSLHGVLGIELGPQLGDANATVEQALRRTNDRRTG